MAVIGMVLYGIGGLVTTIAWIMTLIKIFGDKEAGGVGKGIFAFICGLYALIWGFQNKEKHNLGNVMKMWLGGIGLSVVGQIVAAVGAS